MLTTIDVKFTFNSAPVLGLFSSANNLQISDVALRVVLLLFLPCFSPSSYTWNEWNVRLFFHNQNKSTSSPGFLG